MHITWSHVKQSAISLAGVAITVAVIAPVGQFFISIADEQGFYKNATGRLSAVIAWFSTLTAHSWFHWLAGGLIGFAAGAWLDALMKGRSPSANEDKDKEAQPGPTTYIGRAAAELETGATVVRHPSERTSFIRETVRVSDLVNEGAPIVSGVTFNRCHIVGPGLIKPQSHNIFEFCSCPSRNILVPLLEGSPIIGAILLSRNAFHQCYFDGVTIVGTPQDIANIQAGFDPLPLAAWKTRVGFT
jgi:hypothetical protein